MKTIIFTLCSNNYLAHAKTLGDSVKEFVPEAEFVIGLVDQFDLSIDYSAFDVIKYDQIGFDCFEEMLSKYNIIEFNTAVKPYYLDYLLNKYGIGTKVYYIDPDIKLYAGINHLNELLDTNDILLTPNLTEMPEQVALGELASLRHGLFNLGFIGVKYSVEGLQFVDWWKKRLRNHCLIDKPRGIFVDQKWVDIAILFFKGIHIASHKGLNMAWWNLTERRLIQSEGKYYVNDLSEELIFFHFSGYNPGSLSYTGRNNNVSDYTFENKPELIGIFKEYNDLLFKNGFEKLSNCKPKLNFGYSIKKKPTTIKSTIKKGLKKILK
jgi:hypothetical protein